MNSTLKKSWNPPTITSAAQMGDAEAKQNVGTEDAFNGPNGPITTGPLS